MNLLDKYIIEVGKKLPARTRVDLQAEIRSTIEDMLDDRSQTVKRPIDNKMIEEVLADYGSPSQVASAYQSPRYLIGPRMYPYFILVLKIVVGVLFAVTLGSFLINYYTNPTGPDFIKSLGDFALQFFGGATAALGNIALVFAILERILSSSQIDEAKEEWKPSDLLAEPDPEQVKPGELIFEILFIIIGLSILNLYPRLIGLAIQNDSSWLYVPALSNAFSGYLPWINILGVLSIGLDVYLLRQGSWQVFTRLISLVTEVAGIVLAVIMLSGPSLIKFGVADLAATPVAGSAETLVQLVQAGPKIILAILIVIQSVEVVMTIRHLVFQRSSVKPPIIKH